MINFAPRFPRNDEGRVQFIPPTGPGTLWPHVSRWTFAEWRAWMTQQGYTHEQVVQYVQVDRYKYGFGLRKGAKEPWTWFYLPSPKQVEMHACRSPNVGYGGAAGGSKSHGSRWDAYRHCFFIPNFRAIIMRRTFNELKRNHMDKARAEVYKINHFLGREVLDYAPSEFELRFTHNNSLIIFGHCQNPGDEEKYLSDEYDAYYPDEVATFVQEQVLGVAGRLRSVIEGVEPRMVATTNPSGANTLWFKDWFIDHNVDLDEYPDYDTKDYYFIQSMLYDNPWLMDKDGTFRRYEKRLGMYSPMRRRQLLEGDWSAITGQFFPEFNYPRRFVRFALRDLANCRIERWIDWGYEKPGVCVWVAIFPNGHVHSFFEYKFDHTIASVVAVNIRDTTKEILKLIGPDARISRTIVDPAMVDQSQGQTGETYADTFRLAAQIHCIGGNNQRVLGWGRMRHWLANDPFGNPWWTVDPITCPYTKRTIGSLVSEKKDPEDLNSEGEDHSADLHRYGFMARPMPNDSIVRMAPTLTGSVQQMLNSLQPQMNERSLGQVA